MDVRFACIAGGEIYRQWGSICGQDRRIAPRLTPFGDSSEMFLVDDRDYPYYLLPRHGTGMRKRTPRDINNRANLFALKDMGVDGYIGAPILDAKGQRIGLMVIMIYSGPHKKWPIISITVGKLCTILRWVRYISTPVPRRSPTARRSGSCSVRAGSPRSSAAAASAYNYAEQTMSHLPQVQD